MTALLEGGLINHHEMSQSLTQLGALRTGSRSQYWKVTTSSDSIDIRESRSTRISLVNRVSMLQL